MFHCHVCLLKSNTDEGIQLLSEFDIKSFSDSFLGVPSLTMSVACGCCKAPAANYRQRVLYHSKRFRGKNQQDVLQRYDTRRHKMNLSQLQRCTFHISSWIAKLPASKMIKKHKGLSAVILLRRYLQSLSKLEISQRLCPHLSKLLTFQCFGDSAMFTWMMCSGRD